MQFSLYFSRWKGRNCNEMLAWQAAQVWMKKKGDTNGGVAASHPISQPVSQPLSQPVISFCSQCRSQSPHFAASIAVSPLISQPEPVSQQVPCAAARAGSQPAIQPANYPSCDTSCLIGCGCSAGKQLQSLRRHELATCPLNNNLALQIGSDHMTIINAIKTDIVISYQIIPFECHLLIRLALLCY